MGIASAEMGMAQLAEDQRAARSKRRKGSKRDVSLESSTDKGFYVGLKLDVELMRVQGQIEILQVITDAINDRKSFLIKIPEILCQRLQKPTMTVDEKTLIDSREKYKAQR